jgi:hypothetical protein
MGSIWSGSLLKGVSLGVFANLGELIERQLDGGHRLPLNNDGISDLLSLCFFIIFASRSRNYSFCITSLLTSLFNTRIVDTKDSRISISSSSTPLDIMRYIQ